MTRINSSFSSTFMKSLMTASALLCLSACQTTSSPQSSDIVQRSSVQLIRLPLEIAAETDGTDSLSMHTETQVSSFLAQVNAGYGDIILLDTKNASKERIDAIQSLIKDSGLTFGGVIPLGSTPADQAVMLYVERYEVTAPNCGNWPDKEGQYDRNNRMPFNGCSNDSALALMVANPRDLADGQQGATNTKSAVSALKTAKATKTKTIK